MKSSRVAANLALSLVALALLSACGSSEPTPAPVAVAPAPVPAPPPNPMAEASAACESAVVASFQKARGHVDDQLNFIAAQRKARVGAKGMISASGAATYEKAGKPVKLSYTCTYDNATKQVTVSHWR